MSTPIRRAMLLLATVLAAPTVASAQDATRLNPAGNATRISLDGATAALAPTRITAPVGQVLQRHMVVQGSTGGDKVLTLALVRGGRLVWQSESRPFALDPAAAERGVVLGRLLAGASPGEHFPAVGDQPGRHYTQAARPVTASAVASSPARLLLNGIFAEMPAAIKDGDVLLVAVIPAGVGQRLTAPVVPMAIGL